MALTSKQQTIIEFLQETDQTYIKSYEIADELDLSAKEIGTNIKEIRNREDPPVSIEKWGYTSGTTWQITG